MFNLQQSYSNYIGKYKFYKQLVIVNNIKNINNWIEAKCKGKKRGKCIFIAHNNN